MTTTPSQARKDVLSIANASWNAHSRSILGRSAELRFQGRAEKSLPGPTSYFGRVSVYTSGTYQKGHRQHDLKVRTLYETYATVIVQVFAPMSDPLAWENGEKLAEKLQEAFMERESASGVWFRKPRFVELENDGTWYRWNVISEYRFNQVKGA